MFLLETKYRSSRQHDNLERFHACCPQRASSRGASLANTRFSLPIISARLGSGAPVSLASLSRRFHFRSSKAALSGVEGRRFSSTADRDYLHRRAMDFLYTSTRIEIAALFIAIERPATPAPPTYVYALWQKAGARDIACSRSPAV